MPERQPQQAGVLGFGHDLYSHVVYAIAKGTLLYKLVSTSTKLSFQFRASNPDGILLYTANEPSQADFIECHLQKGKVSCSFSAGGGTLPLTSPQASYSDGTWHTVRLLRNGVDGTLYVDGVEVASGKAAGSPKFINGLKVLQLGGTPEGFDAKRVPAGSRVSFPGCIRNVTVDDKDIGPPTNSFKTQDCYQNSPAAGVSFEKGGGFLQVVKSYSVGKYEEITLEIKPTSHTGVLLSSSSRKGDYIALEMIRGNIIFRAENGGGALVVEYVADNPLQLCNGQWHTIKAWKDYKVVKLQVDDGEILEGGGKGAQTGADVYDPLYIGGLPEGVVAKGVTATEQYTGCIRNLKSGDMGKPAKSFSLTTPLDMAGNVYLGGCPYS
ncbi:Laminin Domain II [Desmophyllum pertusum]|uniref:Laminin Domain II n=1 Tax=Desmophyllum pertusum TaxID=174260 RepID=A0A9X0CF42_9CNID|nr:Laminin Domain II [Desmophyllum pertusum]